MNKKILILTAVFMLSAVSCSKTNTPDKMPEPQISSGASVSDTELKITEYFEEECLTALNCIPDIRDIKCANGKLYITGGKMKSESSEEWFKQTTDISSGASGDMTSEKYAEFGEAQISAGYVTVETKFDETGSETMMLCIYDKNSGELINSTKTRTVTSKIFTDKNDRIYLCSYREVSVYDKELELIKTINADFWSDYPEMQPLYYYDFELAGDGSFYIAASMKSSETTYVAKINTSLDIEYVSDPFSDAGQYITGIFESADGNIILCTNRYFSYINKISAETGETLLRYEVENATDFYCECGGYIICGNDGKIFGYDFMEDKYIPIIEYDTSYRLKDIKPDGNTITAYFQEYDLDFGNYLYIADLNGNIESSAKIGTDQMCITSDGTVYYISYDHNVETSNEQVYETTKCAVYKYNGKDEPEILIDIPKENTDYSFSGFFADESGNIYISRTDYENRDKNEIKIYSPTGEYTDSVQTEGCNISGLFGSNGKIYAYNYDTLFLLDTENMKLEELSKASIPTNRTISKGDDKFDIYYSMDSGIYGYNISDGTDTEVLSFINADTSADIENIICSAADGSESFYYAAYSDENTNIYHLKKANEEKLKELNQRKILILAGKCLTGRDIYKKIKEFNRTSSEFYIYTKDYSKYDQYVKDSFFSGCEQLSADIINGFSPDIIISDEYTDYQSLISMNAFADINEFLEDDAEMSRNDFLENVLETGTQNNILYRISPTYYVTAMISNKDTANTGAMTYDEFFEAASGNGIPPLYDPIRENVYMPLISSYINDFVDFENSSCDFDNDTFVKLIEYLKSCTPIDEYFSKEEYDKNEYKTEKEILDEKLALMTEITDITTLFSEDTVIKGYPSKSNALQLILFPYSFSIMNSSENKEAAWQFIRSFFTKEYQEQLCSGDFSGVPIRRSVIEQFTESRMMFADQYSIPTGENSKQKFTDFINSPVIPLIYSSKITDIISAELNEFYGNSITAEETAKAVQNKVKLYLAEIR